MPVHPSVSTNLLRVWEELQGLWIWAGVPGADRLRLITLPLKSPHGTGQFGLAFAADHPDDEPFPLTGFENLGPALTALRSLRVALASARITAAARR